MSKVRQQLRSFRWRSAEMLDILEYVAAMPKPRRRTIESVYPLPDAVEGFEAANAAWMNSLRAAYKAAADGTQYDDARAPKVERFSVKLRAAILLAAEPLRVPFRRDGRENRTLDKLRRGIDAIDGYLALLDATESDTLPPAELTDLQRRVLELIPTGTPGIMGKQLANDAHCGFDTLRKHVIPALKMHGVQNKSGSGYYRRA